MVLCWIGILGILTNLLFTIEPSAFGLILKSNFGLLYDLLLYYFIISGAVSFLICGLLGFCAVNRRLNLKEWCIPIIINSLAFILYLGFGYFSIK